MTARSAAAEAIHPVLGLLQVRGLTVGYGSGQVVQGVDLDVQEGEIVALLGRNGVGKTTFLSGLMGLVQPAKGSVRLGGVEIAGARPDVVARAGIGLVPQGRHIFSGLTVEENLRIALRTVNLERATTMSPWTIRRVYELLPPLEERRSNRGDQLSGGEQQMLAIGRALVGNPRLLLLDEPSDGLAPSVVRQITDVLAVLADEGLSAILVEQDLRVAFTLASVVHVMEKGTIVHSSPTLAFRKQPEVARRFLGVSL